jgi:hypothetical protein
VLLRLLRDDLFLAGEEVELRTSEQVSSRPRAALSVRLGNVQIM